MSSQRYTWRQNGRDYDETFEYDRSMLEHVRSLPHETGDVGRYSDYIENDPYGELVLNWITGIAIAYGVIDPDNDGEDAACAVLLRFCLSFVQSIDYRADRGEYPRYPSEMLMDGWGDCEDSAILFGLFSVACGYRCAFLHFHEDGFLRIGSWGHVDLGVAENLRGEFSGRYWEEDGVRYYIAHTNGQNYAIGDEPASKYRRAWVHPVYVSE